MHTGYLSGAGQKSFANGWTVTAVVPGTRAGSLLPKPCALFETKYRCINESFVFLIDLCLQQGWARNRQNCFPQLGMYQLFLAVFNMPYFYPDSPMYSRAVPVRFIVLTPSVSPVRSSVRPFFPHCLVLRRTNHTKWFWRNRSRALNEKTAISLVIPVLEDAYAVGGELKPVGRGFRQSCLSDAPGRNGTTLYRGNRRASIEVRGTASLHIRSEVDHVFSVYGMAKQTDIELARC